jgi:hypothetical protein
MQKVKISSKPFNLQIEICGNISVAEYEWRIAPLKSKFNKISFYSLDMLFESINRIKEWCIEKGNSFNIKANFRFKILYFLFNKSILWG